MPIADTALTQVTQYQGPNNSADMAFFAGVKLDGEMLVDADIVQEIKDAKGNNLFQTWAEWNNYVTLRADNPEHVAKFEAIKAALESYEGDRRDYRAELRQRLVKAGFTLPEIDTMGLFGEGEVTDSVKAQIRETKPKAKTNTSGGNRKRARNDDGTYRGDDPSTPDVNEAWED